MTVADYRKMKKGGGMRFKASKTPSKRRSPFGAVNCPNKTEARYNAEILKGAGLYEPLSLKLAGGSRYTPDFVTWDEQGRMTCHEVKGSFRFASESRAVAVVRECAARFKGITFVWATLEKGGKWTIYRENVGGQNETDC